VHGLLSTEGLFSLSSPIYLAEQFEPGYARAVPRTVLIIDDDPAFLRLMEFQLSQEGFHVVTTDRGASVLEILKKYDVDLVVTDMRMPTLDGYDVVSLIKELLPHMPILLTTAHPVNGRVQRALKYEGVVLMPKPFEPRQFRDALASFFPEILKAA
jgi:CheY-like chemotaxis protein